MPQFKDKDDQVVIEKLYQRYGQDTVKAVLGRHEHEPFDRRKILAELNRETNISKHSTAINQNDHPAIAPEEAVAEEPINANLPNANTQQKETLNDNQPVVNFSDQHDDQKRKAMQKVLKAAKEMLYPHQRLIYDDLVSAMNSTKPAAVLPLSVGFGKTFMTPLLAIEAYLTDRQFVYTCFTKDLLCNAMKDAQNVCEMICERNAKRPDTDPLKLNEEEQQYLNDFFSVSPNGMLWIPSRDDGLAHYLAETYFKGSNHVQEKDKYRNYLVKVEADRDDFKYFERFIDTYATKKSQLENDSAASLNASQKQIAAKAKLLIGKAKEMQTVLKQDELKIFLTYKDYVSDPKKESLQVTAAQIESNRQMREKLAQQIRDILSLSCDVDYGSDTDWFVSQNPWVVKMFPGLGIRHATMIFMTFHKLSEPIEPFGMYKNSSMISIGNGELSEHFVVFVDEADTYCRKMIDTKIENAIKYEIGLEEFVFTIANRLYGWFTDPITGVVPDDNSRLKIYFPENVKNALVPNDKIEKKTKDVFIEIKNALKDYGITASNISSINQKLIKSINNDDVLPLLNVTANGATVITSRQRKSTELYVIPRPEEKSLDFEFCHDEKTKQEKDQRDQRKKYSTYVSCLAKCANQLIGLIRSMRDHFMQLKRGQFSKTGYTLEECTDSILSLMKISKEERAFIKQNLYAPRAQSVQSDDFYANGFSIIVTDDSNSHAFTTDSKISRITQLPDYDIANMISNQSFTILASGTGNMDSIQNLDYEYIADAVMTSTRMQSSENANFPSKDLVFAKLPNLQKASDAYKNQQGKRWNEKSLQKKVLCYQAPIKDAETNRKYLTEATGYTLEANVDQCRAYSIQRCCFAIWAMDQMFCNHAHTGLLYTGCLPEKDKKNKNPYNIQTLTSAAKWLTQKYGKQYKFCFVRLDTHNVQNVQKSLDSGIGENEFILYCTQPESTGAGMSLYYCLKGDKEKCKYDIDAIFLGKITNVLPSAPNIEDKRPQKFAAMLKYEYFAGKMAILEEKRSTELAQKCRDSLIPRLNNYLSGIGFNKDLLQEDPESPYRKSMASICLQNFARAERGLNHEKRTMLIGVSQSLIDDGALFKNLYKNIPTTSLFDFMLTEVEAKIDSDKKEKFIQAIPFADYGVKNQNNLQYVGRLLGMIQTAKSNGKSVPNPVICEYKKIRDNAFTFGYNQDNAAQTGYYDKPTVYEENGKTRFLFAHYGSAMRRPGESWDHARQRSAYCTPENKNSQSGCLTPNNMIKSLDFYREHHLLGSGWEDDFAPILPYLDSIRAHGFQYPPYTETYSIAVGKFYEQAFYAMSRKFGAFHTKYCLEELPALQFEDFDFHYQNTRAYIDVKGYSENRMPSDNEKLAEKARRCPYLKPLFIFINAKINDQCPDVDSDIQNYEIDGTQFNVYYINGIAGMQESDQAVTDRVISRCRKLEQLLDLYAEG